MPRPKTVPDGWRACSVMGDVIEGTRFLPFKTPLDALGFGASKLVDQVSNLGLVVNLVIPTRYYSPTPFAARNIEYHHNPLQGGGWCPSDYDIERVFSCIDRFITEHPSDNNSLIGLHCTHGVNRTGYVICRYMIRKLGIDPQEAIRRFEVGRGHSIDRSAYKSALLGMEPIVDPLVKPWHSVGAKIQRAAPAGAARPVPR